jgi:hypothetical protein
VTYMMGGRCDVQVAKKKILILILSIIYETAVLLDFILKIKRLEKIEFGFIYIFAEHHNQYLMHVY